MQYSFTFHQAPAVIKKYLAWEARNQPKAETDPSFDECMAALRAFNGLRGEAAQQAESVIIEAARDSKTVWVRLGALKRLQDMLAAEMEMGIPLKDRKLATRELVAAMLVVLNDGNPNNYKSQTGDTPRTLYTEIHQAQNLAQSIIKEALISNPYHPLKAEAEAALAAFCSMVENKPVSSATSQFKIGGTILTSAEKTPEPIEPSPPVEKTTNPKKLKDKAAKLAQETPQPEPAVAEPAPPARTLSPESRQIIRAALEKAGMLFTPAPQPEPESQLAPAATESTSPVETLSREAEKMLINRLKADVSEKESTQPAPAAVAPTPPAKKPARKKTKAKKRIKAKKEAKPAKKTQEPAPSAPKDQNPPYVNPWDKERKPKETAKPPLSSALIVTRSTSVARAPARREPVAPMRPEDKAKTLPPSLRDIVFLRRGAATNSRE
mgnify:CR=1 FL=1